MQQLIENYKRLLRLTYKALIPFTGHQYLLMLERKVEVRPVWKPMHKQPVYAHARLISMACQRQFSRWVCVFLLDRW